MAFFLLADRFGFLLTLVAYWGPSLILLSFFPVFLQQFRFLQNQNQSGLMSLHRVLVVLGFLFLMLPFITSRTLGLLLVLPGLRHLAVWKFQSFVQKKAHRYFHQFGNGFRFQGQFQNSYDFDIKPPMKDVTPKSDPPPPELNSSL